MRKLLSSSHFYAFTTVLLWSSAYVLTKVALVHFSVAALGFLRCLTASAVLSLLLIFTKRSPVRLRELPWLAASGAAGFALYLMVFNLGSGLLNPTTSCVIISTAPIITALIARFIFQEHLTASGWAATLTAFGGVVLLMSGGGGMMAGQGVFWMLLASLLISIYNIIQRRLTVSRSPLEITTYSFILGTVMLIWCLPEAFNEMINAPARYSAVVVFLGLFPSALAYLAWAEALSLAVNTGSVANYMYLTPFLALILEYLVLGEGPGKETFIGGGVILASLFIFARLGRSPNRAKHPRDDDV